jgi:hypothetical protein
MFTVARVTQVVNPPDRAHTGVDKRLAEGAFDRREEGSVA